MILKEIAKKMFAVLLSIALFIVVIPTGSFDAKAMISEQYPYNFSIEDSQIIITGFDTSISGDVIIPSNIDGYLVVGIADYAFSNCSEIKTVSLPSSLKQIGKYAFSNSGITGFYWHRYAYDDILTIGEGAFSNCNNLNWIFLDYNANVGEKAFYNCTNLKKIYIGTEVCYEFDNSEYYQYKCTIADNSFTNVNATIYYPKSMVLENNTKKMLEDKFTFKRLDYGICGANAFWRFEEATKTLIISGTGYISEVRSGKLTAWYSYASDIESIIIESGFTYIPRYTFEYQRNVKTVRLPNTLECLALNAFNGCSNLNNLILPASLKSIVDNTNFNRCDSLTNIYYVGTNEDWRNVKNSYTTLYYCPAEKVTCLIYNEKIEPTCTESGCDAYYTFEDSSLSNIYNIEREEIAEIPFINASGHNYETVTVENSCIEGGYTTYTCKDCGDMYTADFTEPTNVHIYDNDSDIECNNCNFYRYIDYTVTNGEVKITDCDDLVTGKITIPSTLAGNPVTSIGYGAFNGCSSLTSITIPESVTSIGFSAFNGCSSLTSITIPESVTSIGFSAFNGCSSLTSIAIPEGVTSIENSTFYGCSNLASITIPKDVTSIGYGAFYGCSNLTSITIPKGVTSIENSTFYGCSSLTSVTLPKSVTNIKDLAFSGCSSLASITIPENVTSIGAFAFFCQLLKTVYYSGNDEDWNKISIENGNIFLINADRYKYRVEDLNGDGEINILDYIRLKKIIVGNTESAGASPDFDNSGDTTAVDLTILRKFLLGIINSKQQ